MYQNGKIREPDTATAPSAPAPAHVPDAAPACCGRAPQVRKGRRTALLWGISGTVVSAVGWIALMLFEQYNAGLTELRTDLKHFNEARADLVKKDTLRKMWEYVKDCMKEAQASATAREVLDRELKASERSRRTLVRDVQRLRERLASVEGRQAATAVFIQGAAERRSLAAGQVEPASTVRE